VYSIHSCPKACVEIRSTAAAIASSRKRMRVSVVNGNAFRLIFRDTSGREETPGYKAQTSGSLLK
jgi:hypothetical protein